MNLEFCIPSPMTSIYLEGIKVFIKREDLIHPYLSGNKYRKLKYTLAKAKEEGIRQIISFGGAYSNHIHALAQACSEIHIDLLLFIRGEEQTNPTLDYVISTGAQCQFVSRTRYRELRHTKFLSDYPNALIIEEGGSNPLALKGMQEMMDEIDLSAGQYCVSFGTGGTSIGMMSALKENENLHVYSALKFPDFHKVYRDQSAFFKVEVRNTVLHPNYHFGGYAKWNQELIHFINQQEIPLDPIYTGKLFYGVRESLRRGVFDMQRPIIIIHTGGLQGIAGFNQRFGELIQV